MAYKLLGGHKLVADRLVFHLLLLCTCKTIFHLISDKMARLFGGNFATASTQYSFCNYRCWYKVNPRLHSKMVKVFVCLIMLHA